MNQRLRDDFKSAEVVRTKLSKRSQRMRRWKPALALLLCLGLVTEEAARAAVSLSASSQSAQAAAQGKLLAENSESDDERFLYEGGGKETYAAKLNEWRKLGYRDVEAGVRIEIPAGTYSAASSDAQLGVANLEGKPNVLLWDNQNGYVEYRFRAPKTGLYQLELSYFPYNGKAAEENRADMIRSLYIDGKLPFVEARLLTMKRLWKDEVYPPRMDEFGNQIRPKQVQILEWIRWAASDYMNEYPEPHRFYLTEGEHTLRLEGVQEILALEKLVFHAPVPVPSYKQFKDSFEKEAAKQKAYSVMLEAEETTRKSDPVVQMNAVQEAAVHPLSYGKVVYNVLGGWRWGRRGAWAEWSFEVPSDGYYYIAPAFQQQFVRNRHVYRTVTIDGQVPYQELLEYPFPSGGWQGGPLTTKDGDKMLFKLSAGKHTLRMRVGTGPMRPALDAIETAALRMRELGEKVRRVTGVTNDNLIDKGMNWRLQEYIPELDGQLDEIIEILTRTRNYLVQEHGEKVESTYPFPSILRDLEQYKGDPNRLVNHPEQFGTMQEKLSGMVSNLIEQPLYLDRIYVLTPQTELPSFTPSFWTQTKNAVARFFLTFSSNFAAEGRTDKDAIDVWVARGRDYVNMLQEMADQDFTPRTGIKVNVNLIQNPQILILGNAAGLQPDVALGLGEGTPIDFAMRNALVNLKSFPDYAEVSKRFLPGALMPFHYNYGDWALPETQSFNMLFYRKDVLDKLGLQIPQTWDDTFTMLQTLQQKQMNFYLPPEELLPFLYQNGGEYYSPDGLKSGLDSPEAFQSFKQLTDFFVVYGLDRQANFYQHFRNGTMPVGIADLNTYLLLMVAAPELTGLWGIAPIPGMKNGSGEISRWAGGGMQAGVIFQSSDRKDDAWTFMKWWTSDETQAQYGIDLETINGLEYRWNTANMNAFRKQMWNSEDLHQILEQLRWFKDVPRVPGEYFTDRQYKFAWNKTVVDGANARDSLESAVMEINKELLRKQQEFGFVDEAGNVLHKLDVPIVTKPWDGISAEAGRNQR